MKQSKMLFIVLLLVLVGSVNAYAIIIDINAKTNTMNDPIIHSLQAGTYKATVIGIADGGEYNAWNPWGNTFGNHGWRNAYCISSDQFATIAMWDQINHKDPLDALANAIDATFTLSNGGNINFYIADNNYADNKGGISLNVAPVPQPSTIFLFTSGLLLVGIHGRKKIKI